MLIFIDESGRFISGDGWSVVGAIAIPHKSAGPCRRELLRESKDWPRRDGELKAGILEQTHLHQLVDVLYRHDAVLSVVATDPSRSAPEVVARHQANQADGITKHLTPEHYRSLAESLWEVRRILERMPPQLYLQSVAMHQLLWNVTELTSLYFAQRRPRELGLFEWRIDAKDPRKVTTQEKWWRDVIGPLGESRTRREPFIHVTDESFNYKYFDRSFGFKKEMRLPDGSKKRFEATDIKKLIANMSFVDSKTDIFIQATDILVGFTRRSLRDKEVSPSMLLALGRLMIPRKISGVPQSVRLITLGDVELKVERYLGARLRVIAKSGRPMVKPSPADKRKRPAAPLNQPVQARRRRG
jgi:hypothetical protein